MTLSLITAALTAFTVSVANPIDVARTDVPVVVDLPATGPAVHSVTVSDALPWQLDDLNGDGRADQVCLLVDLAPRQSRSINVQLSTQPDVCETAPGTHAYLKLNDKNKKYPAIDAITFPGAADNRQMYNSIYGHGAVLEGLYSAIRVYMDNRQSVDLYAKNTPQLELETTGFYTTADQLSGGYGRDILWAGTSVAMGSFRGWKDGRLLTVDSVLSRGQRVLADGPLRSIIEVTDRQWRVDGKPVDMTQRFTVYKGHRDYDVEIRLEGVEPSMQFATGVQKILNDNEGFVLSDGLAGSWGNNVPDKGMAHVVDTLGLGISVGRPYLAGTLENDENYLTLVRPDHEGIIRYAIASAALRDKASPRSAAEWFDWLKAWKRLQDNPVKVKVTAFTRKK